MLALRRSLALLPLGLVACTTGAADDAASKSNDLSTVSAKVACSKAAPSADGAYLVYAGCPAQYSGGQIVRQDVATGSGAMFGSYASDDDVLTVGTTGEYAYWAVRHHDGKADFSLRTLAGWGGPLATFALGESTQGIHDVTVMPDGTVAFLAGGSGFDHHLVVSKIGATGVLLDARVGDEYGTYDIWTASAGVDLVLVKGGYSGNVSSLVPVDHSGATPVLGTEIRPDKTVANYVRESFDGYGFVAEVKTAADVYGAAFVDVRFAPGRTDVFADGFKGIDPSFVATKSSVWFTGQKTTGEFVLQRMNRHGLAGDVPQTLLTDSELIVARLSDDERSIVFRTGRQGGAATLGTVPSDGALPPTYVIRKSDNKSIELAFNGRQHAKRYLIGIKDLTTRAESLRLIDDSSAATLGEWQDGVDYDYSFETALTSNGGAVFGARKCNSAGATGSGAMLMQLWPAKAPVTGCETGSGNFIYLEPIPNSDALMLSGRDGEPSVVRVFRP